MADIGQSFDTLASLDSSLTVNASTDNVNGSSRDLGASAPQSVVVVAQFSITNAGTTDGYDLDVRVQFSDDDTNWPDAGQGQELINFFSGTGGADLTRSKLIAFVPLLRYFRFQYDNNNGTDNLSVSSETAEHLMNSA